MKKVFIFFAALASLLIPKEGLGLCVELGCIARNTLIELIEKKDPSAKKFYDEQLKKPIDDPTKAAYDINIYHRNELGGDRPEWLNPLTAAIFFDNKEAFDWLLPDADPLAKTEALHSETPLDYAYRSSNKYYFQELAKTKEVRDAIARLNLAIKDRNPLGVDTVILTTEVNVNIPDQLGNFPIHYAALTGLGAIIIPLVNKGADLNVQNKEGDTPLHLLIQEYKKMLEKPKEEESEKKLKELYDVIVELGALDTVDLAKLNNKDEAPVNLFGFDEGLEKLRNDFINQAPKPPQEVMDKAFAEMAVVKQKIADAKAKVAGGKPDSSGKKVDDKELINALNALQNSLRAVADKL